MLKKKSGVKTSNLKHRAMRAVATGFDLAKVLSMTLVAVPFVGIPLAIVLNLSLSLTAVICFSLWFKFANINMFGGSTYHSLGFCISGMLCTLGSFVSIPVNIALLADKEAKKKEAERARQKSTPPTVRSSRPQSQHVPPPPANDNYAEDARRSA